MSTTEVKVMRDIVEKKVAKLFKELSDGTGLKVANVTLHSTDKVAITLTV